MRAWIILWYRCFCSKGSWWHIAILFSRKYCRFLTYVKEAAQSRVDKKQPHLFSLNYHWFCCISTKCAYPRHQYVCPLHVRLVSNGLLLFKMVFLQIQDSLWNGLEHVRLVRVPNTSRINRYANKSTGNCSKPLIVAVKFYTVYSNRCIKPIEIKWLRKKVTLWAIVTVMFLSIQMTWQSLPLSEPTICMNIPSHFCSMKKHLCCTRKEYMQRTTLSNSFPAEFTISTNEINQHYELHSASAVKVDGKHRKMIVINFVQDVFLRNACGLLTAESL